MQLLIDQVLQAKKTKPSAEHPNGQVYYSVRSAGQLFYVIDHVPQIGETIEVDVRDSTYTYQGKQMTSRWATFKGMASVQASATNGTGKLNQFQFAEALEFYWDKLKSWEMADEAKASVLCTCLIATADGRISYDFPPDESGPFDQ